MTSSTYCGSVKITPNILNALLATSNDPNVNRVVAFSVAEGCMLLLEHGRDIDLTGTGYIWSFVYRPKFDGKKYLYTYYAKDTSQQDVTKYPPPGVDWWKKEEYSKGYVPGLHRLIDIIKGRWWIITLVDSMEEVDVSELSYNGEKS